MPLSFDLSTTFHQRAFLSKVFGKFLKLVIGLVLLPLVAGEVWTVADLAPVGQWSQAWFISLGAGFVTWIVVFLFLPKTMWLYVLGHEFTHAVAAMLAGGKISSFQVTDKGGHVVTDKVNWWITLAPYFVPIYALIWSALWLSIDFYHPLKSYQPIFYFGLGLLWCFHLTFTTSMMHLRQTDLTSQGLIFSLATIAVINLFMFLIVFTLLAHDMTISTAGKHFLHRVALSYQITGREIMLVLGWGWKAVHAGGVTSGGHSA